MKKSTFSFLLIILLLPFQVFSQWMIVDTLCYVPGPIQYFKCSDWCMTKPDVGYVCYHVNDFFPSPHSTEVGLSYIGTKFSDYLYRERCNSAYTASPGIGNLRFIIDTVGSFCLTANENCYSGVGLTVNGNNFGIICVPYIEYSLFTSSNTSYFFRRQSLLNPEGLL